MEFKLRADLDLAQRCLLVALTGYFVMYILSFVSKKIIYNVRIKRFFSFLKSISQSEIETE